MSRFHNFDDAVVREVHLVLERAGRGITIALEACVAQPDEEGVWKKVVLRVDDVAEYRFVDNEREYHYVLSDGLKLKEFGGLWFFDLGPETDETDGIEVFRNSRFYLAGRDYRWEVHDYPEAWEAPRVGEPAPRTQAL